MAVLDFTLAKMKHLAWKVKLRDFLDGKEALSGALTSERECDLGKWLYAEGLAKFGSIPEVHALERRHAELHKTVARVVDHRKTGNHTEAEKEFAKIEPISNNIVELLSAVEGKAH